MDAVTLQHATSASFQQDVAAGLQREKEGCNKRGHAPDISTIHAINTYLGHWEKDTNKKQTLKKQPRFLKHSQKSWERSRLLVVVEGDGRMKGKRPSQNTIDSKACKSLATGGVAYT